MHKKQIATFVPIFLTVIAVLTLMFTASELFDTQNSLRNAPKDAVYALCTEARTTNKVSEQTCGEAQDFYNAEYLCKDNNSSINNQCWVEAK